LTGFSWLKGARSHPLASILAVAFLVRLVLIPLFYDDFNYWGLGVFSSLLLHGNDPYFVVMKDPTLLWINLWRYPPLYLLFTLPATLLKVVSGTSMVYLASLKVPLAVSDLITTLFLFKTLRMTTSLKTAVRLSALYALNPIVIFLSAVHGTNDPIAIMFTVMSFYYFLRFTRSIETPLRQDLAKSALLLGLGVATKFYPLFLVPVFMIALKRRSSRLLYLCLSLLPLAVFSLPFLFWDPYSYLYLLTVNNVGGIHPLFPLSGIPTAGPFFILALAVLLLLVYRQSLSLVEKTSIVFLWVGLAVFATSYNYMAWGLPFFTLFLAEHKGRLRGMVFYPALALLYFLGFNGPFNAVGGVTGPFYLTYPLLNDLVVVTRAYPFVAAAGPWLITASLVVTLYYFASVVILSTRKNRMPEAVQEAEAGPRAPSTWRLVLVIVLVAIALVSWGASAAYAKFPDHTYPLVNGTTFEFTSPFNNQLIDYQWAFGGEGTYQVNSTGGYLQLSAVDTYDRAYLYRGWGQVMDGFQASNATTVDLEFRFVGFAQNASTMIITRMSGGWFGAQEVGGATNFVYFDDVGVAGHVLAPADDNWHNLQVSFTGDQRVVRLDNETLRLGGTTFARLILGNPDFTPGLGGYVQFSNATVTQTDFPSLPSAWYLAPTSILAPLIVVAVVLLFAGRSALPRGHTSE
jgi:hypothetical protein